MDAANAQTDALVHERYDVVVTPTPRWAVPLLVVAAVVVAAVSSAINGTYGARRVTATDRRTGYVVGRFRERWLVNEHSPVGNLLTDADRMTVDEFEASWLRSTENRVLRGR